MRAIPMSGIALALAVAALLIALPSLADEVEGIDVPAPASDQTIELPPGVADDDTSDLITFGSGEWLKGSMKRMRDDNLEFSSDQLGDLEISWSSVSEMRSPEPNSYVFDDQSVVTGPAVMKDGKLTIFVDGSPEVHDRTQLMAIIDGTQTEKNYWSGGAGLGFTARTGNTDSMDIAANAWIRREDANTRLNINYLGAFGTLDGDENTNNHRLSEQFDWFLTPRFYLIPLMFGFYNDSFQNISYRLSPAVGAGYEVYKRGSIHWNVTGGFGYQYTRFDSVPSGADKSNGTAIAVLGTTFGADITEYVEFDFLYQVYIGVPDVGETNHHAEALFSVDLFGPVDLDLRLVFDRFEDPPVDSDGNRPEKNDFMTILGLGVDF